MSKTMVKKGKQQVPKVESKSAASRQVNTLFPPELYAWLESKPGYKTLAELVREIVRDAYKAEAAAEAKAA